MDIFGVGFGDDYKIFTLIFILIKSLPSSFKDSPPFNSRFLNKNMTNDSQQNRSNYPNYTINKPHKYIICNYSIAVDWIFHLLFDVLVEEM